MKNLLHGMALVALLVMMAGCAPDPTENKTEMRVNEPSEPAAPAAPAEPADPAEPSAPAEPTAGAVTYAVDPELSAITFTGSKLTGTHSGGWTGYTGSIAIPEGDFAKAKVSIEIDMTTTYSDDADLTTTLNGENFFDVATYPTSTFVSTGIEATDDGYDVSGDLTLHGVTKNITFPVTVTFDETDLTAEAEFSFNRKLFDIVYDGMADDAIREDVLMTFYIEAKAG